MKDLFQVDAFVSENGGGNPAGVCFPAGPLPDQKMQEIASMAGFSETAFIYYTDNADFGLRYFAPEQEVDLCGHATIASFHYLFENGYLYPGDLTLETKAGIQNIKVTEDGHISMSQNLPQFGQTIKPEKIAPCLGLDSLDLIDQDEIPIQVVSTGLHKIFVGIKDIKTLENLKPNLELVESISREYSATGIYAYCLETLKESTAHCRNLAPVVGISEDSATGTSAAALSCLLWKYGKVLPENKNTLKFEQGFFIDQPSIIMTCLETGENNEILKVWVSGRGKFIRDLD